MNASKDKRKLVFAGCCTLSDDELAELYNLDLLTDEELASVSLERKSLIDDYRHLHELSMLRQQEEEREKERELERQREKAELERRRKIAEDAKKVTKIAKAVKLSSKAVAEKSDKQLPGGRKYGFQLLNQLIKKDFEMTQFSIYMEKEFEIFTDYHTDPSMPLLSAQEREKRRFWAHCDYLENLYCSGSCSRAMNIVVVALIRFSKSSLPTKASASKTRSRIPRPTTFSHVRFR
ncbi:uncharacterized protein Dwil_GK20100 [Drosophila willistoni]|uniref:Uncharacterized protein n=1 Tax=Drosophila willistoni TaxID=7260 RepID=B4MT62_DROWI|nr:uncharacterized protein LOC6641408 [Drosophila willistoni]EDW75301.1 uncharacterized protein Dwil_GK20100 [Drosophila willistoni]